MKKYSILTLVALLLVPFIVFGRTDNKATVINTVTGEKRIVTIGDWPSDGEWAVFKEQILGAVISTGYTSKLTASITSSASTIQVASVKDINGVTLPCLPSNKCYFNIEPGTSRQEPVVCTGVSGTSFTGCTRGLVATGASETGSTTLQYAHNAGVSIIMTNVAQFYNGFVDVSTDQTVGGNKTITGSSTFITAPVLNSYIPPSNNLELVPKQYADSLVATSTFWLPNLTHIYNANSGSVGIGSIPATGYKFFVVATSTSATNNVGIYTSPRTGTTQNTYTYGIITHPNNLGGQITPNVYGSYNSFNNIGTTTNYYGHYIEVPTGTGAIGNDYGLYIENQNKGTSTNYNIYSNGGNNLFTGTSTFSIFPVLPDSYPTASTSASNKGYVDIMSTYISSSGSTSTASSVSALLTNESTSATGYTLLKSVRVNSGRGRVNSVYVCFDLGNTGGGGTAFGQIYINGANPGTERGNSTPGTYATYCEAISSIYQGDAVQIYAKQQSGAVSNIRNFYVAYNKEFTTTDFTTIDQ